MTDNEKRNIRSLNYALYKMADVYCNCKDSGCKSDLYESMDDVLCTPIAYTDSEGHDREERFCDFIKTALSSRMTITDFMIDPDPDIRSSFIVYFWEDGNGEVASTSISSSSLWRLVDLYINSIK